MNSFKGQFTRVKGVSDVRRLPIRDKIRLGVKVVSSRTGKEFPKETDYFVCPEAVRKIYGDQPKELEIRLPMNDLDVVFPTAYIWWGKSKGAKCRGDGEKALRLNEETKEMEERSCPCEKLDEGQCHLRGQLRFFLEKVTLGELFAINLGSYHSVVDINSSLEFIEALVGKFSMIPLKLKRVPRETHGSGRKETHWTLKIVLESNDIEYLNKLRETTTYLPEPKFLLPAPTFENPATDEGAVVEVEEDDPSGSDAGEISEPIPPPEPVSINAETPPVQDENEGMTEEQALEDLKKLGMVADDLEKPRTTESTPAPITDPKEKEAKLLNEFNKEIAKMPVNVLFQWFNKNSIEFKKQLSETGYQELLKLVNDRLARLKKSKGKN